MAIDKYPDPDTYGKGLELLAGQLMFEWNDALSRANVTPNIVAEIASLFPGHTNLDWAAIDSLLRCAPCHETNTPDRTTVSTTSGARDREGRDRTGGRHDHVNGEQVELSPCVSFDLDPVINTSRR